MRAMRTAEGIAFQCPGCGYLHAVRTDSSREPTWHWNGSLDAPTLSPSVLVRSGHHVDGTPAGECQYCVEDTKAGHASFCGVCHSFVRNGRIEFLSDCTHALAGQTVELPELEQ